MWFGETSLKQWAETVECQFHDPEWPAGELYLTDLRQSVIADPEIPRAFARFTSRYRERISHPLKQAIIAKSHFSVADAFQEEMSRVGFHCIVFTSLETACTWLGIDIESTKTILRELDATLRSSQLVV